MDASLPHFPPLRQSLSFPHTLQSPSSYPWSCSWLHWRLGVPSLSIAPQSSSACKIAWGTTLPGCRVPKHGVEYRVSRCICSYHHGSQFSVPKEPGVEELVDRMIGVKVWSSVDKQTYMYHCSLPMLQSACDIQMMGHVVHVRCYIVRWMGAPENDGRFALLWDF